MYSFTYRVQTLYLIVLKLRSILKLRRILVCDAALHGLKSYCPFPSPSCETFPRANSWSFFQTLPIYSPYPNSVSYHLPLLSTPVLAPFAEPGLLLFLASLLLNPNNVLYSTTPWPSFCFVFHREQSVSWAELTVSSTFKHFVSAQLSSAQLTRCSRSVNWLSVNFWYLNVYIRPNI